MARAIDTAERPKPFQPTIVDHGIFVEHDMPCAVCQIGHAVYACHMGIFAPCWDCQEQGWRLRHRRWWKRLRAWFALKKGYPRRH